MANQANTLEEGIAALVQQFHTFIPKPELEAMAKKFGITVRDLAWRLLPTIADQYASPGISSYHVSVAGFGADGHLYLGYNHETKRAPTNRTWHGEQAAMLLALFNGTTLERILVDGGAMWALSLRYNRHYAEARL